MAIQEHGHTGGPPEREEPTTRYTKVTNRQQEKPRMGVFPAEDRHGSSRNGQAISGASVYSEDLLEREISEATCRPALSTGQDTSSTQSSGLDSATPPAAGGGLGMVGRCERGDAKSEGALADSNHSAAWLFRSGTGGASGTLPVPPRRFPLLDATQSS
jgi:hypothetical protein